MHDLADSSTNPHTEQVQVFDLCCYRVVNSAEVGVGIAIPASDPWLESPPPRSISTSVIEFSCCTALDMGLFLLRIDF